MGLKLLILDAHCHAAVAVVQSFGRLGHQVNAMSHKRDSLVCRSRYLSEFKLCVDPEKNAQDFHDAIISWHKDLAFDWIIPCSDLSIMALMSLDALGDAPWVLPKREAFDLAFNKEKTLRLAKQLNISVPDSVLLNQVSEFNSEQFSQFPYFVKHTQARAWLKGKSLEATLVQDKPALIELVESWSDFFPIQIQNKVSGVGVGIEVLCKDGEVLVSFAHRRVHEVPLSGGGSSYRQSILMPKTALSDTRKLMKALNWQGIAMIEFKWDIQTDTYVLMEINGRVWGSLPLAIRAGVDFPALWLDVLMNRPIQQPEYLVPCYARHLLMDVLWFKLNAKADAKDLNLLTRPMLKSFSELGRLITQKEKWDHFYWDDLSVTFSLIKQLLLQELITTKRYFLRFILRNPS
jgi:predicted ATP-grasp superfamily ATP-dependent carboligase